MHYLHFKIKVARKSITLSNTFLETSNAELSEGGRACTFQWKARRTVVFPRHLHLLHHHHLYL
uniref:Uncharacterized protein n=1 Tax=Rhizophora mucronata TaxID=61149 RepID=A0A2P2NYK2_RHIMU